MRCTAVLAVLCAAVNAAARLERDNEQGDVLEKAALLDTNATANQQMLAANRENASPTSTPVERRKLSLAVPRPPRLTAAYRRMMKNYAVEGDPHSVFDFEEHESLAIGRGATGLVFRCRTRAEPREEYAVKRIIFGGSQVNPAFVLCELEVFSKAMAIPYGTRMHSAFLVLDDKEKAYMLYIVMNVVTGGSLGDVMGRHVALGEGMLRNMVHGVLTFLKHMHAHRIVHRDIKPDNILVDDEMNPTVCDYGMSYVFFDGDAPVLEGHLLAVGTPFYFAPELVGEASRYSYGVDVWALGITAMMLATRHSPYDGWPEAIEYVSPETSGPFLARVAGLRRGFLDGMLASVSPALRDFLEQCLEVDPSQRPSAETLLKHPFIAGTAMSAPQSNWTWVCSWMGNCFPRRETSHNN